MSAFLSRSRISKLVMASFLMTLIQVVPSADWGTSAFAGTANPGNLSSTTSPDSATGAYIIDAGQASGSPLKQTIAQGLKPYGLVYALVKAKIPVQWIINPDKSAISQANGNSDTDFSFACTGTSTKQYRSGAFVIAPEFGKQAAGIIAAFKATTSITTNTGTATVNNSGVVVDGPCTNPLPSLRVYATIKSWPRVALDAQNGSVAIPYFTNAGIPYLQAGEVITNPLTPPSYRFVAPSALTACDDVYVMPHADPTYATHSNLIQFVKNGGDFYASCHAVSVVENMTNGTDLNTKVMNFLSTNGLVNYDLHVQGSPSYKIYETSTAGSEITYTNSYISNYADGVTASNSSATSTSYTLTGLAPGDPIAQFIGVTDAAQQQGSEQIFMPTANSRWRPTTQIVVYDPTQANVTGGVSSPAIGSTPASATCSGTSSVCSVGPAASVVYGPAFGNSDYGQVMYVGGHSSNKGTADDVAAQRLFFNFLLLASVNSKPTPTTTDRTPSVTLRDFGTTKLLSGQTISVSGAATGGSGVFRYQWAAACYDRDGNKVEIPSSQFLNSTSATTTFTTPSYSGIANCNLTLTAIDSCGRYAFGYQSVAITPESDIKVVQTFSGFSSTRTTGHATIVVTNQGPNTAGGVTVTSKAPTGASYVAGSLSIANSGTTPAAGYSPSCTATASNLTCDLKDMLNGQIATFVLDITPSNSGSLTNVVDVSTLSLDTNPGNNSDGDTVDITAEAPAPRLEITKTPSSQYVASGGKAAFRITVKNVSTGNFTFTNILLTDTYSTGGQLSCSEGADGDGLLTSPIGAGQHTITSLAVNDIWTAGCEITGITNSNGQNTIKANVSTVTSDSDIQAGQTAGNINPIEVTAGPVDIHIADVLELKKSIVQPSSISPGGEITYKLEATNNTSGDLSNVKFDESNLPKGLTYVAGSGNVTGQGATLATPKISGLLLLDKFDTSTIGNSGSSTWNNTGSSSTSDISISSDKNLTFKQSSDSGRTYKLSRKLTLDAENSDLTVFLDCYTYDSSKAPKLTLNLTDGASPTKTYSLKSSFACSSTRTTYSTTAVSIKTLTDYGLSLSSIYLQIIATGSSNSKDKTLYVDNVAVVAAGFIYQNAWNADFSSSSKIDAGNKLKGNYGSGNKELNLQWAGSSSSDTATAWITPGISGSSNLSNFKLSFTYANEAVTGSNYVKISTNQACSTTIFQLDSSNGTSNGTPSSTSTSSNVRKTVSFTATDGMKIYFCFKGNFKFSLDDLFITAAPLGEIPKLATDLNPEEILIDPSDNKSIGYSLAKGKTLTLTFKVKVDDPYTIDPSATGLVNLGGVTSNGTNFVYAVDASPWDVNPLTIEKTVDTATAISGDRPTFTYKVKNIGPVTLSNLTLSDDGCAALASAVSASTTLTSGQTRTYTCQPANDTQLTLASQKGTVTAGVDDPSDPSAQITAKAYLVIRLVSPAIQLNSVDPVHAKIASGSRVAYTYKVVNTGTIGLTSVLVNASNCSTISYYSGDLNNNRILEENSGETWTFKCLTGAISVNQTTESVTVSGANTYNGAIVTSSPTAIDVTVQTMPSLTLTKQVSNNSGAPSSSVVVGKTNSIVYTYTLTATNGSVTNISIGDSGCSVGDPSSGDTNGDKILQTTETWNFTCNAGTLQFSETATAVAYGSSTDSAATPIQSGEAATFVDVQIPGLLLTVEPEKEYVVVGSSDLITYTVENTGTETFSRFDGNDSNCTTAGALTKTGSLAPGQKWTMTCTYAIPRDTLISFTGTGTYSGSTFAPDTATAQVFAVNPQMTVRKTVKVFDSSGVTLKSGSDTATSATADLNDKIVFKYWVSAAAGTGASQVDGLNSIFKNSYTDSDCNSATYAELIADGYNLGDSNHNGYIDPTEEWVWTCTAKASLTAGTSLRAAPLPKVSNGGIMIMAAALKVAGPLQAYATSYDSPVTITGLSSLDDPSTTSPIVTLSGSATVTLVLPGSPAPAPNPGPTLITPTITWPNPSTITWPTPLGPTQLNAVAKYNGFIVPGTYTYQYPSGTILKPGTYRMKVTFTPTNSSLYAPVETYVEITVLDPAGTITWKDPEPVVGPYKLDPSVLNATCDIPGGTLVYDPALGRLFPNGTYTLTVTCQPPAGSEYKPIKKTVTLIVGPKAQPTPVASPATTKLDPPSNPQATIVSRVASTISWSPSKNATGYLVTIDSHKVCTTTALKCKVQQLVGPKSDIKIYATKGSLRSTYISPKVALKQPMVVEIIYFDTAKFAIRYDSLLKLRALKGKLENLGYKRIVLSGHTDSASYDNETLSKNRATQTQKTLEKLLPGGYSYDLSYHGATTPMKDNSSPSGMAANRRVEIAVW